MERRHQVIEGDHFQDALLGIEDGRGFDLRQLPPLHATREARHTPHPQLQTTSDVAGVIQHWDGRDRAAGRYAYEGWEHSGDGTRRTGNRNR